MNQGLVVVTGASKGIGKAIVEKYGKEGFSVVACARNGNDLDKLQGSFKGFQGDLQGAALDMSIKDDVNKFSEIVKATNKPVKVLVNNVGVFLPGNIIDEPDGNLETQIATNLYSAYYLTRGLMSLIEEHAGSHIFNMCSTASLAAYPNGSSYSITKYALLGFSHNLREELKSKGIKVTAVLPGNTLTPSWGDPEALDKTRFIMPEDVADTVYSTSQLSSSTNIEEILIQPTLKQ